MKTQNSTIAINWAPQADYQDRNKVLKYIHKAALVENVKAGQAALSEYDNPEDLPEGSPEMLSKAQLFDEYQRLVALYNAVMAGERGKHEPKVPVEEEKAEKGSIYGLRLKMIAQSLKGFVDGSSVTFMTEIQEILNEGHSVDQLFTEVRPYVAEQFGEKNTDELLALLRTAVGDDNGATFLKNYEEDIKQAKKDAKRGRKGSAGTTGEKKAKSSSNAEKKAEGHGNRADAQDRLDRYSKELEEKEVLLTAGQFATKEDRKACVKRIASLNRKIARANRALGNSVE